MASLEDVARQVRRAGNRADECAAALRQAGESARDAAELLRNACQGAVALEDEAAQAGGVWNEAADGAEHLATRVSGLDALLRSLIARLVGNHDATASAREPSRPTRPLPENTSSDFVARWRDELPDYITSGRYEDETGRPVVVQSGRGAESPEIARHLFDAGILRRPGMPFVAMHVEPKVAWRMRTGGRDTVELVINNKVCQGDLSCRKLVEDILYEGQTLVVHDPTEDRPLVFKGRSPR